MFSHDRIWAAIDRLAAHHKLSASGLAKKAGLDPTTFNRSKRSAADGRLRWPSTESIAKILDATGESLDNFLSPLLSPRTRADTREGVRGVPLIGFAQAGAGGFFDDAGFPAGQGWDEVSFPSVDSEGAYALEVAGDSMLPLYRSGDRIIVSPNAESRRGDRVVVRTRDGEVMAKILARKNAKSIELLSLNPDHPNRMIALGDIDWIARILWASQ